METRSLKIDWTQETAENIIEILKSHYSLTEALEEISEFISVEKVSGSAVRHGLIRYGFSNPSYYLANRRDDEEEEEAEEDIPKNKEAVETYEYRIDFEKSEYRFCKDEDRVTISFEQMQHCHFLYSGVKPGLGLSAGDVSGYLYSEGVIQAGAGFVQWMFRRIGFSKSMYPAAPHLRFSNETEISKDIAHRQDSIIKSGLKINQIKEQEKELKQLREKNEELVELLQFKEQINGTFMDDIPCFSRIEDKECTLIIPLGDLHVGKKIDKRFGFTADNHYDLKEFRRRLGEIEERIIHYADGNAHRVNGVVIHGLGDWFESPFGNLREGIMQTMFGSLQEQWIEVVNAFCRVVRVVLDWFPDVPVLGSYTPGNHDRIHKQKEDNTEYLLGHILTDRIMAEFRETERFQMRHVSQAVTSDLLPNGLNLITMHGHVSSMSPTSPDSAYVNLAKLHERNGTSRTLILAGHYHAFTVRTFHSGRMIWVPSMCGSDSYSRDHILKGAPAEFLMIESYLSEDVIVGPFSLQGE